MSSSTSPRKSTSRKSTRNSATDSEVSDSNANYQNGDISKKSNEVKATFTIEELTPDDEIYTFQCPKDFFIPDLFNKNIDLSSSCEIPSKGETYRVEFQNSNKKFLTLAVPSKTKSGALVNLPFKGNVIIQKVVNTSDCKIVQRKDDSDENKVVFPTDIKERHPLLGVNWKAHIKLANDAFKNDGRDRKSKKGEESDDVEVIKSKLVRKRLDSDFSPRSKKKRIN